MHTVSSNACHERNDRTWVRIKGALRKNCLKPEHIMSKLVSCTSNVQKSHKYHNTLLQIEAYPKTEETRNVSNDVTYAAPSKRSEEVLLKICGIEVMDPNDSIMQA